MVLALSNSGQQIYAPSGRVLSAAFWDRSEFSVIQGPIGSGTSSMCCHKIFKISCEQEPNGQGVRQTRWLIIRETYPKLEKTTAKTWLDWFPEDRFGRFRRSVPPTHLIRVPHPSGDGTTVESEVIMLAIENAEEAEAIAASFEITGFWLNEAQFTDKKVVDELLSRCGRYPSPANGPGATWYGGFADMNAPIEGHWIPYMRGDIPLPREMSEDVSMGFKRPESWKFFMQPPGLIETIVEGRPVYHENPAAENTENLVKSYLQQISGKTREWIDRRILNKTGLYTDGKAVYPTFSEQEHLSDINMNPVKGFPVFVGLDFGREPAAVMGQCFNSDWRVMAELIGENEPASEFAPRLKKYLAAEFPGYEFIFGGDPRGADGTQASNETAYDIFRNHGMIVLPSTNDNNVELRRSTVTTVLTRRDGLLVAPKCLTLKTGLAGGYHFPPLRGYSGIFADRPRKNRYSHPVEAFENMLLIGGEGSKLMVGPDNRGEPHKIGRRRLKMRKY
jgi:hypothetical protein